MYHILRLYALIYGCINMLIFINILCIYEYVIFAFIRNISGLPFFDVILMDNLPKSASLPVSTVQQAKLRIRNKIWDFDYVFFTESDQV